MKNPAFAFLLIIALLSCKSKPGQQATDAKADTIKQLIPKLKPILSGVWVKSDYIDKIKQTHSVLAAVPNVTGVTGISIDTSAINGDSLRVDVGWDNHNPGTVMVKFMPGKHPQSVKFDEFELAYQIKGADTSLILYQVYDKVLYTSYYHKILPYNTDENLSYGMRYAINQALIAGDYTLNEAKKTTKVTFNSSGDVKGIPGAKGYLIESDLKYGPMANVDQITFDAYTSHQQLFNYVFKGDKLELYEVKPDAKQNLLMVGKLKYSLTRVK